jgi:hypothetical protein
MDDNQKTHPSLGFKSAREISEGQQSILAQGSGELATHCVATFEALV